ncbi:hypothetical protein OS493_035191 [Desmophyllum pertusum]|uniref:Apple domain-containing protein n=1 Tax=Desmophyllum pertusum TaxID=174260 RepID=A0A9W9ZXL7_9CNID|nr:hypothetical protein OS493_035191 [Desmophyllum pertusum]
MAASVPDCDGYDGVFPNDTVFCEGYKGSLVCTNDKECCKDPNGCFNILRVVDYTRSGQPNPHPEACSRKTITIIQRNNTDKAIYGHVIVYHKAVTVTQCGDFCLREPRCRAFNLATVIDPEGKKDCELLEEDKKIINRQGFSFWLFDRDSYKEEYLAPLCGPEQENPQAS